MESKASYKYDAFISHAVEDKIPIANELCARLEKAGFRIWYSGQELMVGNRLAATIEAGLEKSRFGIVVLSPTYVKSKWTLREFYSLLAKEKTRGTVILPVLYDITPAELALEDLVMAETFAVSASRGMDHVVTKLIESMTALKNSTGSDEAHRRKRRKFLLTAAAMLLLLLLSVFYFLNRNSRVLPDEDVLQKIIESRIQAVTRSGEQDRKLLSFEKEAGLAEVTKQYLAFKSLKSYYRNEYHLVTGYGQVDHKKNVAAVLRVDLDTISPLNGYTITSPRVLKKEVNATTTEYFFSNPQPLSYDYTVVPEKGNGTCLLKVVYRENIRHAHLVLAFPPQGATKKEEARKHHRLTLYALPPSETFLLSTTGGDWEWKVSPRE